MAKSGKPNKGSTKRAGSREVIQSISHRVMGSRQSLRKTERSGQSRQPKRGRGSQRSK